MARFPIRYGVDSDDRIRSVGPEWPVFASENAAADLDPGSVVGRPLWDFIADAETRDLYRLIFDAVRVQGREVTVPFRCDSPECRWYMELAIAPLSDRELSISSQLIREEPREHSALLDTGPGRSDEFVKICSWCKRVLLPPSDWCEVEVAVRRLGLFDSNALPNLTHGVCPDCEVKIGAELERVTDPAGG